MLYTEQTEGQVNYACYGNWLDIVHGGTCTYTLYTCVNFRIYIMAVQLSIFFMSLLT